MKKITCFLSIFCLFTVSSFVPAFGSALGTVTPEVIDFPLLNDAFATLYFMCGLDYNVTAESEQGLYELMDEKTREIWANEQAAKKERLDNALDEFIDSVKRGYGIAFNLDEELYETMQNSAYSNIIAPSTININAPTSLQNWLASQNGNIILINNEYRSPSANWSPVEYWNVGTVEPLTTPYLQSKTISQGSTATTPAIWYYTWRLTPELSTYPIMYHAYIDGNNGLRVDRVDWLHYAMAHTDDRDGSGDLDFAIIMNHTSSFAYSTDALINDYITKGQYTDIINGVYGVDTNGDVIIDETGDLPNVIGRSTLGGYSDAIEDGSTTWGDILGSMAISEPADPSIPIPDGSLTLPELDTLISDLHLERLESKFPFCIPHDLQLIYNGATSVSSNAPVLNIPLHLEFNNYVYYDNQQAIHIDFSMFDSVIPIFREGFFLLFLVGLLWVSIEILQAFFVVTE